MLRKFHTKYFERFSPKFCPGYQSLKLRLLDFCISSLFKNKVLHSRYIFSYLNFYIPAALPWRIWTHAFCIVCNEFGIYLFLHIIKYVYMYYVYTLQYPHILHILSCRYLRALTLPLMGRGALRPPPLVVFCPLLKTFPGIPYLTNFIRMPIWEKNPKI